MNNVVSLGAAKAQQAPVTAPYKTTGWSGNNNSAVSSQWFRRPADQKFLSLDDLFEALAVGIESYYTKTGAFRSLGLSLSGGRDSMLTLLVAWRAAARILGSGSAPGSLITAFYMPTRHSQDATRTAAHELAAALGVALHTVPLDDAYDRGWNMADRVRALLGLTP